MSPVTVAIIGAGNRGSGYAEFALKNPENAKIVAVAEPMEGRRSELAKAHNITDPTKVVSTYKDLASQEKFCDAVVVATLDQMHTECVIAFAKLGYHILCEKPLATDAKECVEIAKAVENSNIIFAIGHVLRYSPYNAKVQDVLKSGAIGDILNIVHVEPIGNVHYSHSYVRGNWAKENETSFSLLTKSCHDLDIISCYLGKDCKPKHITSFGDLTHFKKENKPKEAGNATKCFDCPLVDSCAYSAKKVYLDRIKEGHKGWPISVLTDGVPDIESVHYALDNKRWGKCVYELDNDVCDHQVVNIQLESGTTVSFTMVAFTEKQCDRQTRIHGTKGELIGDMYEFSVYDFESCKTTQYKPDLNDMGRSGHGGGDLGLMRTFIDAVKNKDQSILGVDPQDVLKSHLMVFAAEHARLSNTVVNYNDFVKSLYA